MMTVYVQTRGEKMSCLNKNYTFDRFVVGSCNDFAQAAAIAAARAPAKNYNPLFIYGSTGLGKTHLLHAIGLMIAASQPDCRVMYVSAAELTTELINAIRTDRMPRFREKYRNAGCLLVDDVHDLSGKDRTQEELFHTFNTLHDSGRQVVIAGGIFPKDIPHLEERLRSRFQWGLIAEVKPPDIETRTAIIKRKMRDNKTVISDDAAHYIAAFVTSNIGELEGFLVQVSAYSAFTGSEINIDLVKRAIKIFQKFDSESK
jgi:chromosomal replication initiator protein